MSSRALSVVGIVVLVLFAVFVWPTKWRYDTEKIRTNRFTSEVQTLDKYGWIKN